MKKIINFAKKYWKDFINFQSTWWNISVKEDGFIYIKSSWYKVYDIYEKNSFSKISICWFNNDISKCHTLQEDILSKIIESNNTSEKKASIETWFHMLIKSKYVVHTHNLYINILLCSKKWQQIFKELFVDEFDYIWYFSPWLALFEELDKINNHKNIIFLKNHWIISHSDISFEDAYNNLSKIENTIRDYLKLKNFDNNTKNLDKVDNYLFPDIIVLENDKDIASVHQYTTDEIVRLNLEVDYLNIEEVEYIRNMKQEKYRKNLINK